ncbi:MAG: hypothetical protein HOP25_00745 [Methylotenera sp.]|nr:hypothetical protein [Methylotenera sp.]
MLHRYFLMVMVSFALLAFSPAQGAISINASSSLDTFDYDLDTIHLKLEKMDARWQLSPFGDGKLVVDNLRAKRLIITLTASTGKASNGLPERIKPPFPLSIQQAEVSELLLISGSSTRIFNNVKFALEADAKTIKLNKLRANTPWGEAAIALQIATTKPFALTGTAAIKQAGNNTPYDIKALLSGDLNTLHFESSTMLAKQAGKFVLFQQDSAQDSTTSAAARILASGQIGLAGDYPVNINAKITDIQPQKLGNYPAATLNFNVDVQGKLLPDMLLNVQYNTHDSLWQKQVVSSAGKLVIENSSLGLKLNSIDAQAAIADNIFKANGSLGQPDSRLEWQANLPDLSKFGVDYSGEISAKGTLEGVVENLALQFSINAQKLHLPGNIQAEKLVGTASMLPSENGKLTGEFTATKLQYGKHPLMDGQLTLQGTRANHQLKIAAQSKTFTLQSLLQGGLTANNTSQSLQWQGLLQSLVIDGSTPIKLAAPAPLSFDTHSVNLQKANLQLAKGRAFIDQLQLSANGFSSKGHLEKLALDDFPSDLLPFPTTLEGDAIFSAKWDFNSAENLNGNISLWREAGDLTMLAADGSQKPLGLQDVKLDAIITNNQAVISTKINGSGVGNLEANIATTLTKTEAGYALLASAPLIVNGAAQLHTLAWLPLPPSLLGANLDGALNLQVAGNGTLKNPNLSGNVSAKNLQFSLPTEGVNLVEGTLEANFENDKLVIKQAAWRGGEGYIKTSGSMMLVKGKPVIDLDWTSDKFTVVSRADRLLILSGAGKTTLEEDLLMITGNFTINKGLAELANEDAPVLGDDVIILGQVSAPEPALRVLLNGLRISLGDKFRLRGRGLDAELTGALTFTGLTQYHPHTEGGIQVKSGTYMAYGQVLTIERGLLNFSGTVDNPGINIRAMRNSKPVNAGIEITGSATAPATKLVSDPTVADSEKLSWLVLGHGMDQTTKNDYGVLSLAAGVLLSQGQSVPLQTQLARAAGLDELSFSGGDATNASFVFGKRLSSRLYLSYAKSISGLLDVARLTFNITQAWSIRAEAGTESAVDVLYTFSFK